MDTAAVRRVLFWNRIWLGLLLVGVLSWGARWLFTQANFLVSSLHVVWRAEGLALTPGRDGPFVVTHLILDWPEASNNKQRAVAELPRPVVIIDSDGAIIPTAEFKKLIWRDIHGQSVSPPQEGAPLRAFYYCPLRTAPAGQ